MHVLLGHSDESFRRVSILISAQEMVDLAYRLYLMLCCLVQSHFPKISRLQILKVHGAWSSI